MNATCKAVLFIILACVAAPTLANDVIINGTPLDDRTKDALESYYQTRIPSGRYWYDPFSGVWGLEGGPAQGQILPGLRLGGPLRANASNGTTGVFVNGRQLHYLEVAALQRCTTVIPGRYWIAANGVGGVEGGPPAFNLAVLCGGRSSGGGSSTQCEDYGNGQFNCSNSRTGIGMISEGGGRGAVFVDGKMIMTPN
jgi:hypothetical protein